MSRAKLFCGSLVVALVVAALWVTPATPTAQSGATGGILRGNIKSADGKAMEGVTVSARSDKSWTTSVFTDREGNYFFPAQDSGNYKVWAQAVGFEAGRANLALTSGRVEQNFTLKPNADISQTWKQMSGTEMLLSLPDKPLENLRGRRLLTNNCTGCHTASWVLQNRWSEADWGKIVDLMAVYPSHGRIPSHEEIADKSRGAQVMRAYRDELAKWLGQVRGATEVTEVKPLPRPTGVETQVVVTEFDFPRTDNHPGSLIHDGSDWSMGTPSRYVGRAAHDLWVAPDGMVWAADDQVPLRTTASVNPKTGEVKNYYLLDPKGNSLNTHSVHGDARTGLVWLGSSSDGNFVSFDPKTEQFKHYPRPADMKYAVGGSVWVAPDGNPWATSTNGAIKLDVATGKYTHYASPNPGGGYGAAVDRKGNAWATQPGVERVVKVDGKTGKVDVVEFRSLDRIEVTQVDRDRSNLRASQNSAPPQHNAPRRMSADPSSDNVWVSLYTANKIAKIDINTLAIKEYELPHDYSMPYANITDKNGNVWINAMNLDRIVKFDPKTEKFTEYKTPTLGAEIRHITVDNSTDPPTVWVPYARSNKIVRFQFRTATQQQTQQQ